MSPSLLLALSLAASPSEAPRPYDVQHYAIQLRLAEEGAFENSVAITLVPAKALGSVELDSFGLDVKKVELLADPAAASGEETPFTLKDEPSKRTGLLTLKPKKALAAKKPVTFRVSYLGKAATQQEGFFRVEDTTDETLLPYYFTQFEPTYARRFFPSNDRPDDKATTELFAVVPADYQVVSNGKKLKDETFSEGGNNLRRVHWKQEQPHPTYAVALGVGQFEPVEVTSTVPATIWVLPGRADRANIATHATEHALPFQQRFVGVKYPWAKYDQVTVPKFVWGGMENTSLVFTRENGLVLEDRNHVSGRTRISGLIAHELAHQWFGDYVTCKSWRDIWLNEGFATFMTWKSEDAYYENDYIEVTRARRVFVDYFRQEDGPRSRPLVAKSTTGMDAFDSTSYAKGAHVLRMLEHWVGEEKFKAGLKAYLEKHAHSNASSEDFFAAFTKATGTEKELKGFQQAWLHQRGYPVVTPEMSWDGSGLNVTIRQKPNHAGERGTFVFKLPVVFHREGTPSYTKEEVIVVDKPEVRVKFALPAAPTWVNWNQDGTALVKINSAAVAEEKWVAAARSDPDPVWRTLAAFVLLGELVNPDAREQKTPSVAAMDAIAHVLGKDSSPYVREAVLDRLAESQWKRLPENLGPLVLELARRPTGLAEDAIGIVRVRKAALAALGKFDHKPGRTYLFEQVSDPKTNLDYLPAAAVGTANVGDSEALATLRLAIRTARPRGYAYYKAAASGLGSVTTPEVVPVLQAFIAENGDNNELMRELIDRLQDNKIVKSSPQLAELVHQTVVDGKQVGDEVKVKLVHLLDEVKTKDAKDALATIVAKSDSEHLQATARQTLDRNFPGASSVKPASGKKKK